MAMRKESAVDSWIPPIGTRRSGVIDLAEKSRIIFPHPALLDPVQDALHMIRASMVAESARRNSFSNIARLAFLFWKNSG